MSDTITNLVVVAHPDDEILGFGGAGTKFVKRGEVVQPVMLCGGVEARENKPDSQEFSHDIQAAMSEVGFMEPVLGTFPNIRMNTVSHLDVVQFIEKQILKFRPQRIFTHHPNDLNDDHGQVSKACLSAARLFQRRTDLEPIQSLHFMEIPSSTDWAFANDKNSFQPNEYVEINQTLHVKLAAMSCYRNVMRPFPHPRSVEAITGLAAVRGGECGLGYAEAFQTIFSTRLS